METIVDLSKIIKPSQWSLGKKFISILLLILLIPIASVGLLKEIEKALVGNLRENLLLSASLIGNQLAQNKEWFEESLLPDSSDFIGKEIFVFPLDSSFNLDGYFDDWINFEPHRQSFGNTSGSLTVLVGYIEGHLILSIAVKDDLIIYSADAASSGKTELSHGVYSAQDEHEKYLSDQLEIEYKDEKGNYHSLYLVPKSAGDLAVRTSRNKKQVIDWRYKAYWIETQQGFNVELKFPSNIKPTELRLISKNLDKNKLSQFSSQITSAPYGLNPLVWPSKNIVNYIENTRLTTAQRIWVLDTHRRVLASSGNLKTKGMKFSSNPILNWVLASQSELTLDPRADHLRLDSTGIYRALKGESSSNVENIRHTDQSIALATYPIKHNDKVLGVLLLEENVARIQLTQKKALINMFLIILSVLVLVVWVIFWYVSRLVKRIKTLNKTIEQVVDNQGRMQEPLVLPNEEGDEIDDLNRSFGQMGARLFEYNDHLEKLASRLSHELRTPIAIVRSSLDNLLLNCQSEDEKEIIERALQGNQRLGEIITRMRQASGVKEAMQTAEKEEVDIVEFMRQLLSGYSQSFKTHKFELICNLKRESNKDSKNTLYSLSPDLFAEMLDKLIANAIEFSDGEEAIKIRLDQKINKLVISVENSGPVIKKKNRKRIFQSLVSIRDNNQSTGTNLGLGLYVVKLISEFHGASVRVDNLEDGSGVVFSILWAQ